MRRFRTYHDVTHDTESRVLEQVQAQRARLTERLAAIRVVLPVVSGKGGVGKSAVAANLAASLAARGARVGALDADLNGPSLGRMLGARAGTLEDTPDGIVPAAGAHGVRVMSMDLLQPDSAPLRWRGPEGGLALWQGVAETGTLREFLSDVAWGALDYLVIDAPPGTDRIARLLELVPRPGLTLLVTTPTEITRFIVLKSARLLEAAGVSPVGLVANMVDSEAGADEGVAALARESGLEVWARIPYDRDLARSTDAGRPWAVASPDSPSAAAFAQLAGRVARAAEGRVP